MGALALRTVGNGQKSFYFLSVLTGRVLNRLHATKLPMPDDIIDKIHRMARQQKNNPGLIFAEQNLNPDEYDDDDDYDDDETYRDNDNENHCDQSETVKGFSISLACRQEEFLIDCTPLHCRCLTT